MRWNSFTFENVDGDGMLVVCVSRKHLGLLGRDDGVAGDELRHDSSGRFNAEGERANVQQDQVVGGGFSPEDATLDCRPVSDRLVRVDADVGLFSVEEVLDDFADFRNPGRASDHDDFVDFALGNFGIFQHSLDWFQRGEEKVLKEQYSQSLAIDQYKYFVLYYIYQLSNVFGLSK